MQQVFSSVFDLDVMSRRVLDKSDTQALQYGRCGPQWRVTKQEEHMAEKLGIGATVPSLTLNLVGGSTAKVPDLTDAKYQLVLFYRGHW